MNNDKAATPRAEMPRKWASKAATFRVISTVTQSYSVHSSPLHAEWTLSFPVCDSSSDGLRSNFPSQWVRIQHQATVEIGWLLAGRRTGRCVEVLGVWDIWLRSICIPTHLWSAVEQSRHSHVELIWMSVALPTGMLGVKPEKAPLFIMWAFYCVHNRWLVLVMRGSLSSSSYCPYNLHRCR